MHKYARKYLHNYAYIYTYKYIYICTHIMLLFRHMCACKDVLAVCVSMILHFRSIYMQINHRNASHRLPRLLHPPTGSSGWQHIDINASVCACACMRVCILSPHAICHCFKVRFFRYRNFFRIYLFFLHLSIAFCFQFGFYILHHLNKVFWSCSLNDIDVDISLNLLLIK